MLNFNQACETAIAIFIWAVEGLSVCWSGHVHGTELMALMCVFVCIPDY